jgi:hypothetical protein
MARTVIADIRDNRFPPLSIAKNTFVVWRNLDPHPHSAETTREAAYLFNAGALLPGEASSPVYFDTPGAHDYLCRFHADMNGVVRVSETETASPAGSVAPAHPDHPHLKHFHGFVTGGRTGQKLFMTHTPVIADPRHHFQVILQSSLTEPAHVEAYERLRTSTYADGKVQIFHDHLSLEDIGAGIVTQLPEASFEYYPDGVTGTEVPGLEEKIPVRIDRILHFHRFDPDTEYPEGLAYLVYGDLDDVFIDHFITRAPNFHSVAKLARVPPFWTADRLGSIVKVVVPAKRIRDVSPKLVQRVAFVDNRFHLFWLPPTGVYSPAAQDPMTPRGGGPASFDVVLDDGSRSRIDVARWLHFDVRLLNYGVLIV